ncbi:MAG TPA: hypothetical protein VGL53_11515, partial [Bryobacteraceae bacterium]
MGFLIALADPFWSDIRFGLRSFRRTPPLTLLALLSLALGIGATTTIFCAVYSIIVDPFPYGDSQHLMSVQIEQGDPNG